MDTVQEYDATELVKKYTGPDLHFLIDQVLMTHSLNTQTNMRCCTS